MPFAPLLSTMSASARAFLARIGRRYGTREVRAQARQTLIAHARFAVDLRSHGFGDADAQRMKAGLAAAESHLRTDLKTTDRAYVLAVLEAKNARARARSVLLSAYRRLRTSVAADATGDVMAGIDAILTETSEPGGDDRVYAAHLDHLLTVLAGPQVAAAVAGSGGPEAAAKCARARDALRALDEANPPAVDLDADIIDGLLVELCRTAQFAAQSASKEVGNATIALEFRLGKLMSGLGRDV